MKKSLLVAALLLISVSAFANTTYNNFAGYSQYWQPLGNPNTATYGETFTAPTNGDNALGEFSFYLAGPITPGNIIMAAYIATWTGSKAGTLLYTSPSVDYANTGNAELTFDAGGLALTAGASYVAFLSVSEFYGQSKGESYASIGDSSIPGSSFVFYNNAGDFNALFNNTWDVTGWTPNWGFEANFTPSGVPEPATLLLIGMGLLGLAGVKRKFQK